jgi:hypothetical protein
MTLGELIQEGLAPLALPAPAIGQTTTALVLVDTLKDMVPDKQRGPVAKSLYEFIASDAFAAEVDKQVGDPTKGESEDEYVHRARSQIKKLLMERFTK